MGFADLHIHSIFSYDGIAAIPAILEQVADHTGLNVIAITDHDSMGGVDEAVRLAPRFGIEVIPGMEISTAEGHLLALWIHRPIPAGLSLVETLARVKKQGGLAVAPHPSGRGASSLSFAAIARALASPGAADTLVGIEAFNSGMIITGQNDAIARQAAQFPLAQMGNSDAHTPGGIGVGSTEFEGSSAAELRAALLRAETRARPASVSPLRLVAEYAPAYLLRLAGWALWSAGPGSPAQYRRQSSLNLSMSLFESLKPWFASIPAGR